MLCLFHPALKLIYFIRNICDRYFFRVYCVVLFSVFNKKRLFLVLWKAMKNRTKRNTRKGFVVVLETAVLCAMFRDDINFIRGFNGSTNTEKEFLLKNQFHVYEIFMKIHAHIQSRKTHFPSKRAEPTVFCFSTPKTSCIHPRDIPSLPPFIQLYSLCTVDPDSNWISLNISTWIWETPLDAKLGISLPNCFLDMK